MKITAPLFLLPMIAGCTAPFKSATPPAAPKLTITRYMVKLSWQAPQSSSDPVVSYNLYRNSQLLENVKGLSYIDNGVVLSTQYTYYVTSVDSQGNQSGPSNTYIVNIPGKCTYANPGDC